ncbi:hypothetical protein KUTeg_011690 [Tegillarca granosa]|uniref:YDG domain-containing protein n=1 Tax=Tegillarca granosa TaxID=220873 RepID=A0ABQ9F2K9_TEGGR|nr:hypothetical protein KUTeg_011690 [Tegillarca granosa]
MCIVGGRDLKGTSSNPKNLRTAPQSKDQELTRGNLALSKSVETGNPVRVIRGYKLDSPFAPEEGYRYDGKFWTSDIKGCYLMVEKYWYGTGLSGFGVIFINNLYYVGLYRVEKYWYGTGLSGFGVWRFALRRLEDQAPPPWTYAE